jgi:hypothetical protein
MHRRDEISPVRHLAPRTGPADHTAPLQADLNLFVVFTSIDTTLPALQRAADLAAGLGGCIHLIVAQIVPYPLPLDSPPVPVEFNEQRLRIVASQIAAETAVDIYLCRDRWDILDEALKPHSVVVVGRRKRWWPGDGRRLARKLRQAGHEVVLTEVE